MKAKITKIKKEACDTKRFELSLEKELEFKPGQFIKLKIPGFEISRAYSMSSAGGIKKEIELTIRIHSDGILTQKIDKLREGDEIEIEGPYGKFFFDDEEGKDVVLITAGICIATIRSIIKHIKENKLKNKITLFYSAKKEEDLVYKKEFEKEDMQLHINLTREKDGRRLNKEDFKNVKKDSLFFIVGPNEFVKDITEILKDLKIKENNIKEERYGIE
jgi:NAD(P)H-flavin reductase